MAYNIGEAVALSTILPSDQGRLTSSIIQKNQDQAYRQAQSDNAKRVKDISLKPEDFRVNDPNLYPYYAEQIRRTQEEFIKDYYRNGEKVDYEKLSAYQSEVARLRGNNNIAREAFAKKIKGEFVPNEPNVVSFLSKSNPTDEERLKANDEILGVTIDERGNFGALTYSPVDFNTVAKKYQDRQKPIGAPIFKRTAGQGTKGQVLQEFDSPPEDREMLREEILTDVNNRGNFIMRYRDLLEQQFPDYKSPDPQKRQTAMVQAAEYVRDKELLVKRVVPTAGDIGFPPREPQESAAERGRKPRVDGNTVTLGNAKWTYYTDGDKEIWTPSRTDVSENKVFDFEDKKGNLVKGRVKSITSEKGSTPVINVVTEVNEVETEVIVPYKGKADGTGNNIGKIKNEFNADPYMIKKMLVGNLDSPEGVSTGTAATGTKSNLKKASAPKEERKTVRRKTKDGRVALFDSETKEFISWE